MTARVVESGVGGVACFLLESESFFQNCWSRESESVLKKWEVGVWSRSRFYELQQFMGWSRNPKKSSDSTTLDRMIAPINVHSISEKLFTKHDSRNFFPWHHGMITNLVKVIRREQVERFTST